MSLSFPVAYLLIGNRKGASVPLSWERGPDPTGKLCPDTSCASGGPRDAQHDAEHKHPRRVPARMLEFAYRTIQPQFATGIHPPDARERHGWRGAAGATLAAV